MIDVGTPDRDGSGVAYSSHLRPLLTWRPDFLSFNDAAGSGLRHLPADTHLTGWLDRMGVEFDVVTDHDVHEKGVDILKPYKVVLTGSHPEYHTERTLDALQAYTEHDHVHAADTREQARENVKYGLDAFCDYFRDVATFPIVPGDIEDRYKYMVESGMACIGTPDDAIAFVERLLKGSGGFGVIMELAQNWAPWRSVATWYLWRSLDPVPVEY